MAELPGEEALDQQTCRRCGLPIWWSDLGAMVVCGCDGALCMNCGRPMVPDPLIVAFDELAVQMGEDPTPAARTYWARSCSCPELLHSSTPPNAEDLDRFSSYLSDLGVSAEGDELREMATALMATLGQVYGFVEIEPPGGPVLTITAADAAQVIGHPL